MHPKNYLSWSQLSLWERDPDKYIRQYIQGEERESNGAMDFGSKIHNAIDKQEHGGDLDIEHLLMILPKYPEREFEISGELGGVKIFGKLDGFNQKKLAIGEYKTGVHWSQAMVDKDDQLTFYASLVYTKFKKFGDIFLHWIPTQKDSFGTISIAGEVQTFLTTRNLTSVLRMSSRVTRAWREIGEAVEANDEKLGL